MGRALQGYRVYVVVDAVPGSEYPVISNLAQLELAISQANINVRDGRIALMLAHLKQVMPTTDVELAKTRLTETVLANANVDTGPMLAYSLDNNALIGKPALGCGTRVPQWCEGESPDKRCIEQIPPDPRDMVNQTGSKFHRLKKILSAPTPLPSRLTILHACIGQPLLWGAETWHLTRKRDSSKSWERS